ncbi:MAG: 30S ribosomal protein S13 [Candidatus Diapherotrites archaeon]
MREGKDEAGKQKGGTPKQGQDKKGGWQDGARKGAGHDAQKGAGGKERARDPRHDFGKFMAQPKDGKDIRYIVRIANRDLNGSKPIRRALTGIKGISTRTADAFARVFEAETGIGADSRLGEIPEGKEKEIEELIMHPEKHGLPSWILNRRNDFESGESVHLVENDLQFSLRKDLQRLSEIKSYRGLRLMWGLPVRGQKTKSTHRGKGGAVGVVKKDVTKAAAGGGADKKEGGKGK